jgi:hypothetical protein
MMGRLNSDQGQLFYEFQLSDAVPEDHLGAEDRHCSRSVLASQRACASLFVHRSSIDRPGTNDPDAGRGVCLAGGGRNHAIAGDEVVALSELNRRVLVQPGRCVGYS